MNDERTLNIDGKVVLFRIGTSTQAMSVRHDYDPTEAPPDKPFLSAHVGRPDKPEWSGILLEFSGIAGPPIDAFSDDELRRLYAEKGPRPRPSGAA